jgi:hypothetical protein
LGSLEIRSRQVVPSASLPLADHSTGGENHRNVLTLRVLVSHHRGDDAASFVVGHIYRSAAIPPTAVEQYSRLIAIEHRGLTRLHDMGWSAHGMCRVHGDDLAGHQPVEQFADRRQVLLDGRLFEILAQQHLYLGRNVQWLDIDQLADMLAFAPGEEPASRMKIGLAGVAVADGDREVFEKPFGCPVARISDQRRHHQGACGRGGRRPDGDGEQVVRVWGCLAYRLLV